MLPRYLLVTPAWYDQGWWRVNDDTDYSCSVHEREEVMSLTLGPLQIDFLAQLGDINTDTGIVRLIIYKSQGCKHVWDAIVTCVRFMTM